MKTLKSPQDKCAYNNIFTRFNVSFFYLASEISYKREILIVLSMHNIGM